MVFSLLYAFDENVECSLKGRHKHQQGLVVRTLCGLVLCMGRDCGKQSIIGFEGIIRTTAGRRRFQADLKILENWSGKARVRLDEISRIVQSRTDVVETMRMQLSALYAELFRRWRQGAKGDEVHIKPRNRQRLPEELRDGPTPTFLLVGMNVFESKQPALGKLRATLAQYEKLETEAPPIDGPSADALRKLSLLFDDRAQRLEEWRRETVAFLTENNLRLALVALNRDNPHLNREGNGWRVGYMPGESAILPLWER